MGLLFGKRRRDQPGGETYAPIRKSQEPTQPRGGDVDTKRVRLGDTNGVTSGQSAVGNDPRSTGGNYNASSGTGNVGSGRTNGSGGTSGGNYNGGGNSGGVGSGLESRFTQVPSSNGGAINGFSKASGGAQQQGNANSQPLSQPSVESVRNGFGMNSSSSNPNMSMQSPLERVVNLYGISLGIFNITRAVLSVQEWNDPLFIQLMEAAILDLDRELRVLKDADKLRDWVHPLHYRKTGSVIGAGRRIQQSHKYFMEWAIKLKQTGGEGFGPSEQRQFKESLKEMIRTFLQLLTCCEMVVASDFNTEINELARTMRDVVDTASGKLNFVFDDVARICTTSSIRLARLALWKSLQVSNITWSRQVNDTCYTVTKATKVLYIVGQKLYENMADRAAYDNLTALTKGIVMQIKKLQGMVQTEPPEQKNVVVTFTPEVITEHMQAYDQGIKEVTTSLNAYVKNHTHDITVIGAINKIISQLEAIKNTVRAPDNSALVVAIASISDSAEKFCGAIYHALYHLGDENEVLKEQVMETMQHILHCTIQLQLVAVTKGLFFTIVNPEATMLTCLRSLLLSVSIVVDAIDYIKSGMLIDGNDTESVALLPEEINEAIVYILHYGRPLYKGEGEMPDQFEQLEGGYLPNNPVATTTATTTTTTTTSNGVNRSTAPVPKQPSGSTNNNPRNLSNQSDYNDNIVNDDVNNNSWEEVSDEPQVPDTTTSLVLPGQAHSAKQHPKPKFIDDSFEEEEQPKQPQGAGVANSSGLTDSEEELLNCNPDNYNENLLPPGFDPPPAKPVYVKGSTQEQYKAYMVAKYEFETWENKLILHKIKLKKQIEELKAKKNK